jgi:hypothetical protein
MTGIEVKGLVVDGDDAGLFHDLVTGTPIGRTPGAEWLRLRGDEIAAIDVFFDARPWAEFMSQRG